MGGPAGVDETAIRVAAEVLRRGGLVAFPTETVYGLGADATNEAAVRRLFAVKGRPDDHPVIVHVADVTQLGRWGIPSDEALQLADAFWPGPLTVIVEKRSEPGRRSIVDAVTGGRSTVGVRVPDHPVALALVSEAGVPIAAPSANRFGRVSPTTALDVRTDLADDVGDDLVVLDGGPCAVGVESTIVDCTGGRGDEATGAVIRRLGGVARSEINRVLGRDVAVLATEGTASGTLASHYAPRAQVEVCPRELVATRLGALGSMRVRAGVLARTSDLPEGADSIPEGITDLTVDGDLDDLARELYRRLRRADELGLDVVVAVLPELVGGGADDGGGLGEAIADRLRRAAGVGEST